MFDFVVPTAEQLAGLTKSQKIELLELLEERERRASIDAGRQSFLHFAHRVYPGFKEGPHHRKMAQVFEAVLRGEKKRVIVNMPPRFGKSEFSSYLFPSYFLGQFPNKKIIMATHTAGLSEDYGRRVRNLIQSEPYQGMFPDTQVAYDSKAAGKWSTTAEGQYYAVGVGGALAGRGADLLLVDDAHSEQDVRTNSKSTFESCWAWFQTGPLQRLMPGGSILVVMTRWGTEDLTGKLVQQSLMNEGSADWEVIELPAILPSGKSLWPEQWPVEELEAKRDGMDARYWSSQYMQDPTSEEGALVKRESWRIWPETKPPHCETIIQVWDTAFTAKESADFSACTTWGVFGRDNDKGERTNNIILLDAFRDRMEFPELKKVAFKHYHLWKPDNLIVEAKASGAPLIQEMRSTGIPVQAITPSRGTLAVSNDKTARLNRVTDIFASGFVWRPDTRWAQEVAEEVAAFPHGSHDDYVDTIIMALTRFRQGGFIRLPTDEKEEPKQFKSRRAGYYSWRPTR